MVDKLFLQILNMSYAGGVVIIFVLAARLFLKKAPKMFSYALWIVALFRLICPFSFESIFSLIPVSTKPISNDPMYSQIPQVSTGISGIDHVVNSSLPAGTPYASVNPMQIWFSIGEVVWLTGIAVILIYSLVSFIRLQKQLNEAVFEKDNIFHSQNLDTPFVLGIVRPKIYLPASLSASEKEYILLHEQTHIKRFDHVVKILSFLVLCIHWFNPLVWIAFFVSGKDMEMSCDETVIKKLGGKVKKEYSSSLLTLATGKRVLSATPLAFGEGDTKNRIKNVLSYKKPAFGVVIIALAAILALSFGLLSNPKQEVLTIEDYANQYIEQVVEGYEQAEYQNVKIVESKITSLDKLAVFDNLTNYPIEVWSVEYRLKPDNIQNVMLAGGMNEIDGWLTEDSSMGKPMMIFSFKNKAPEYLGVIWSGEMGSTLSSQEVEVRKFLESSGHLPPEFYAGKHVIVKFQLSTGETSQVLLSQPVIQGTGGIWCVERWMDGNGTVYYNDPQVDSLLTDYYTELQKQCDDGDNLWLLNPSEVALVYINQILGQYAGSGTIEVIDNASVDDFMQTPISTYIGFISNFAESYPDLFHFDPVEWITLDDTKRIDELGIPSYDMPNGYYIHNPNVDILSFQVNEETVYNFIDWGNDFVAQDQDRNYSTTNKEEFIRYLNTYSDKAGTVPFWVETKDGYVKSITEQFVN